VHKAQSVMEYLMTYGWALLVVGIVIIVLAQLGVFNSSNFTSGAQPGGCEIVKLSGSIESLNGNCNNQIPRFVASFGQVVGNSSVIGTAGFQTPYGNGSVSVFAWINSVSQTRETVFSFGGTGPGQGLALEILGGDGGTIRVDANNASVTSPLGGASNGGWHFIGFTHAAGTHDIHIFIDGLWSNATLNGQINLSVAKTFQIGASQIGALNPIYYSGQISNVQLYNTSLSGTQVTVLYLEGIGGTPVSLSSIVGWWPLNGNGNDYSGENQQGVLNNITFLNNWMNTYTAP